MSEDFNNDPYVTFVRKMNNSGILPKAEKNTHPDERRDIHAVRAYHINAAATLDSALILEREIREARSDFRTSQESMRATIVQSTVFVGAFLAASVLGGAFIVAASSDQDSAEADASHTCVVDATKNDADVQRQLDVCEQARQGMGANTPLTIKMK